MMDGSRKVSLRNRRFVRKINVPVPASGVKPSQFVDAQSDGVDDVQHHQGDTTEHGECEQLLDNVDRANTAIDDGGLLVNNQVTSQDRVVIADGIGRVPDGEVDQTPLKRSQRVRKPNSKYDPEVFDLDSLEIRGIPLSAKKIGWKGVYWPT